MAMYSKITDGHPYPFYSRVTLPVVIIAIVVSIIIVIIITIIIIIIAA